MCRHVAAAGYKNQRRYRIPLGLPSVAAEGRHEDGGPVGPAGPVAAADAGQWPYTGTAGFFFQ